MSEELEGIGVSIMCIMALVLIVIALVAISIQLRDLTQRIIYLEKAQSTITYNHTEPR